MATLAIAHLKGELGEFQIYFKKDTPASTKIFVDLGSFQFAVAEKFEKMPKMKLLSSFQLLTQILTFQLIKANFVYEVFITS